MSAVSRGAGPVKAWIEPDRWAFLRAFPVQMAAFVAVTVGSVALAFAVHPLFWALSFLALFRHAAAEASLRELFREGMLHPSRVVARGLLATLVRLEGEGGGIQDAVVISRLPRRWRKKSPPWGGDRAAVVIAGQPPKLRPLTADFAAGDIDRARRATERIPETQWRALDRALSQLAEVSEGVHPVELGSEPWYGTLSEVEREGSLPEHVPSAQTAVWCAGLPCVEQPEMVDRERARVARLTRRSLVRAALLGAISVVLPSVLLAAMHWAAQHGHGDRLWLSIVGVFTAFTTPFVWIATGKVVRRAWGYQRDLVGGRVLRFSGTLSSFDSLALDPDLALLTRRGLIVPEPGVEQDLVVLPRSGELLYANGQWAPVGVHLHVERVAPPPDSPLKLPLPEDVEAQAVAAVTVARRRLTRLELEELERHVSMLRRPGRVFWALAAFVGLALLSWHADAWAWPPRPLSVPIALAAWGLATLNVLKRTRLASRLENDLELGWVLTVDHEPGAPDDVELPAQGVETLLHARLDWTVNRRPATWRRFGARER